MFQYIVGYIWIPKDHLIMVNLAMLFEREILKVWMAYDRCPIISKAHKIMIRKLKQKFFMQTNLHQSYG